MIGRGEGAGGGGGGEKESVVKATDPYTRREGDGESILLHFSNNVQWRERERERDRDRETERERETDRQTDRQTELELEKTCFYKDCSRGGRLKTVQSKTFLTMRERERERE